MWAVAAYLFLSKNQNLIALLILLLGPFLISFLVAFLYGALTKINSLKGAAGIGLFIGIFSQVVGVIYRSMDSYKAWINSISSPSSGGNHVITISSTIQPNEILMGIMLLIAIAVFGGWSGERIFGKPKHTEFKPENNMYNRRSSR
ncbi:hypothetical protein D3C78_1184650 [compost metagenome]